MSEIFIIHYGSISDDHYWHEVSVLLRWEWGDQTIIGLCGQQAAHCQILITGLFFPLGGQFKAFSLRIREYPFLSSLEFRARASRSMETCPGEWADDVPWRPGRAQSWLQTGGAFLSICQLLVSCRLWRILSAFSNLSHSKSLAELHTQRTNFS